MSVPPKPFTDFAIVAAILFNGCTTATLWTGKLSAGIRVALESERSHV